MLEAAHRLHFLRKPVRNLTEGPEHSPRSGDGLRPVAVLHRRVGFRPRLRGFAQLQGRLVGDSHAEAGAEEGHLLGFQQVRGGLGFQDRLGLAGGVVYLIAEMGAQQGEGGGGEPGLHHGLLVGEAEGDGTRDESWQRRILIADDPDQVAAAVELLGNLDDLARGTRPAQEYHGVVFPGCQGSLGSGEGVREAEPEFLTQSREGLGNEPRRAAAQDRDFFARLR